MSPSTRILELLQIISVVTCNNPYTYSATKRTFRKAPHLQSIWCWMNLLLCVCLSCYVLHIEAMQLKTPLKFLFFDARTQMENAVLIYINAINLKFLLKSLLNIYIAYFYEFQEGLMKRTMNGFAHAQQQYTEIFQRDLSPNYLVFAVLCARLLLTEFIVYYDYFGPKWDLYLSIVHILLGLQRIVVSGMVLLGLCLLHALLREARDFSAYTNLKHQKNFEKLLQFFDDLRILRANFIQCAQVLMLIQFAVEFCAFLVYWYKFPLFNRLVHLELSVLCLIVPLVVTHLMDDTYNLQHNLLRNIHSLVPDCVLSKSDNLLNFYSLSAAAQKPKSHIATFDFVRALLSYIWIGFICLYCGRDAEVKDFVKNFKGIVYSSSQSLYLRVNWLIEGKRI